MGVDVLLVVCLVVLCFSSASKERGAGGRKLFGRATKIFRYVPFKRYKREKDRE